jgi:hypothetical protein
MGDVDGRLPRSGVTDAYTYTYTYTYTNTYTYTYTDAHTGTDAHTHTYDTQIYPGKLQDSAVTADSGVGAVFRCPDCREPERCNRWLERFDRACQFCGRFRGKRL